ncbi:hypothetical protein [Flindersiella endophytica]
MSKDLADFLATTVALSVAVAVLVNLHPEPVRCIAVLRRWGVRRPTAEQGELAAGYFKRQERLQLAQFAVIAVPVFLLLYRDPFVLLLCTVLLSVLIGELAAVLRPALRGRRSAVLLRRGVSDVVPRLALVLYGFVTVVTLAGITVNLIDRGFGGPNADALPEWLLLAGFLAAVAAGGCAVWLSVIRGPAVDDSVVDAALRIRSARVATGISQALVTGVGWVTLVRTDVADGAGMWIALTLVPIAVVSWIVLFKPVRSSKLIEANRQ